MVYMRRGYGSGRMIGVGVPNLEVNDSLGKQMMLNMLIRRRDDSEYNADCLRRSVLSAASTRSKRKPVTLPKLKCLDKEP